MAEDKTNQDNTPSQSNSTGKTNSFVKGMVKDFSEIYIPEGTWTNAINAVNTSHKGDEGNLGNEQSNKYCTSATYTIIGLIHKYRTEWVVFATDNVNSEIGIFDESDCSYTVLVNDRCLNFNTKYLITGAVKYNADCTYSAYWADNNNPDRTLILDSSRIPYKCNPKLATINKEYYYYTITRNELSNTCGAELGVNGGSAPNPPGYYNYDIGMGSIYGLVTLTYDAQVAPDRFIVYYNGNIVIDTGYVSSGASGTAFDYDYGQPGRGTFISAMTGKTDPVTNLTFPNLTEWPDDGYPRVNYPGTGTETFMKDSPADIASLRIFTCFGGSERWDATLSCPDPEAPGVPPMPEILSTFYYIDTEGETIQVAALASGESTTFCALKDSVTGFPSTEYTLSTGELCDTIYAVIEDPNACGAKDCTNELDCDQLRLHLYVEQPCVTVNTAIGAGQLQNGSYQAVVAYSHNGIRLTDYSSPSTPQALWDHTGMGGSLDIHITGLDLNFEEYELVIISTIAEQTVAKKIGNYDIRQTKVHLDQYLDSLVTIPLAIIPLKSVIYEKSKKMFSLNNYLIRTSVTTQPHFNYQPFANSIRTEWVAVQYPADYYWKGGNKTGYMRDEVYAFFIRWVYKTGARSASYHIPGRAPIPSDLALLPTQNLDLIDQSKTKIWQTYDTSTMAGLSGTLPDGGEIIAKGNMAYWESGDGSINPPFSGNLYPNNHPEIWGNLCNKPIRHHKMPSNETIHIHDEIDDRLVINVLGVQFSNILHPVDNAGNPISDISGYEILRGSREGNRSVIAKGIFNNMLEYNIPGATAGTRKGMIQNYPYNDLNTNDPFLHGVTPVNNYFSFNSPETIFVKPYLGSGTYMRIYKEQYGVATGAFEIPYKHPKEKLINDGAFILSLTVGLGIAALALMGKTTKTYEHRDLEPVQVPDLYLSGNLVQGYITAGSGSTGSSGSMGAIGGGYKYPAWENAVVSQTDTTPATAITDLVSGGFSSSVSAIMGGNSTTQSQHVSAINIASTAATWLAIATTGLYYLNEAMGQVLEIIYKIIGARHYVVQYNSHGFYRHHGNVTNTNVPVGVQPSFNRMIRRSGIKYIGTGVQDFDSRYRINNIFRGKYVCLNLDTNVTLPNITGALSDVSKVRVNPNNFFEIKNTNIASYYGALKIDYENQYGQLSSIVQISTDSCVYPTTPELNKTHFTAPIFGGDVYINRYTDKNPYFFFNTWMIDMPDETAFNYQNYVNGPDPVYWANFEKYDMSDFDISISGAVRTPSDFFNLERGNQPLALSVHNACMYLFHNGVKDFFTESELNMAFRDYGENDWEKFYDVYGSSFNDVSTMFRSDIITKPVFYKYDLSLSTAKLYNNFTSWGMLLPPDYDPVLYETCYEYFPYKGIYSLQQQDGLRRDNWRNFLPLNYYTFEGIVTNIKSVNSSGALILYEDFSPSQFVGVDTLKTETGGTKITIGDGGLFANNIQSLVNAEDVLEYGASISNRATLNTPFGLFFVSQKAGKILQYGSEGMNEISKAGMKNWFLQNLPSELLKAFPDYTEYDNPVVGIGVQAIYDAQYELLYFTKKDYKPLGCVGYDPNFGFYDSCAPDSTIVTCDTKNNFVYNPNTNLCERVNISNPCGNGYTYDGTNCIPDPETPVLLCPVGSTYDNGKCNTEHAYPANATVSTSCVADIIINIGAVVTKDKMYVKTFFDAFFDAFEADIVANRIRVGFVYCQQGTSSNISNLVTGGSPAFTSSSTSYNGTQSGLTPLEWCKSYFPISYSPQWNNIQSGMIQATNSLYHGAASNGSVTYPSRSDIECKKIMINVLDYGPSAGGNYDPLAMVQGTICGGITGSSPFPNSTTNHYPGTYPYVLEHRKTARLASCLHQSLNRLKIFVVNTDPTEHGGGGGFEGVLYNDIKNAGSVYAITNDVTANTAVAKLIADVRSEICAPTTTYSCNPGDSLIGSNQCLGITSTPALPCDLTCEIVPVGSNAQCSCTISSVPVACPSCNIIDNLCNCIETATPQITHIRTAISLDDPNYFQKIEWTISYDPKEKMWISFHDWHPTFLIPSYNHFFTIKGKSFWKHNERFDSFTNYYNIDDADLTKDYGWEVEYNIVTPNQITTLRSIEYYMEAYKYYNDGKDMFHILDENFDRAIIYNSEQVSPLLALNIKDKNKPLQSLQYPIIGPVNTQILASKEENKYRFNNFYDVTNDRHEFASATAIVPMFITAPDGYHKSINPAYIDVLKVPTEHKKFRHFGNKIILRKTRSGDKKMLLKLVNSKMLNSSK